MQRGHVFIGDDGHARTGQKRRDLNPRAVDQAGADAHVIGAVAQRDMNGAGHFSSRKAGRAVRMAAITRRAVVSISDSESVGTRRSARA